MKILSVVGARPQFIKAAAVSRAIIEYNKQSDCGVIEKIVHTGQHYDGNMSKVFFDELKIPRPAVNLEVGSGSHGRQTGLMLERLENVIIKEQPDWVLIYGDTNSTLAGALAAAKLHVPVAHVEAGLRSFNRKMPEEINRVVADHLSALLFCPTDTAVKNLRTEGLTDGVHQVGDVMYDSVLFNSQLAERSSDVMKRLGLDEKSYYLATIHRAENTDDKVRLDGIISAFEKIEAPIVLPLHPRTKKTLGAGLRKLGSSIRIIEPVAYLDMLMLEKNARLILTDSGGVQKEAYWFNVPCITLRDETEWVELVEAGCNEVVGADSDRILYAVARAEEKTDSKSISEAGQLYGNGQGSGKIVNILGRSC
ncbi:MAG: non-hydrolyzing UDP-N-acetylglucosamine 2-epimerase [Planctomycetota bacterium]